MYIVAIQLKTLIADGMATRKVRNEKIMVASSDWPLTNMWWPQTRKLMSGDGEAGEGDGSVAEDVLVRKVGISSVMIAHAGQDHDVDRRVRVEPEEVLVQHRVAAHSGIENADPGTPVSTISSSSVMPSTGVASTWMMAVA